MSSAIVQVKGRMMGSQRRRRCPRKLQDHQEASSLNIHQAANTSMWNTTLRGLLRSNLVQPIFTPILYTPLLILKE